MEEQRLAKVINDFWDSERLKKNQAASIKNVAKENRDQQQDKNEEGAQNLVANSKEY